MSVSKEKADGVSVKKEDQGKINKFARKNALLQELKDELKSKMDILRDIEEAEASILMTDDPVLPYRVGEVFFEMNPDNCQAMLDQSKKTCKERISGLEEEIVVIEGILSGLKVELYARFGNNINLEPTSSN